MPKLSFVKGSTSVIQEIFIQDSSKTDGSGLTGLTSGSAGLVCYRARTDDGNAGGTQLSLSAGTRGTWSSGGFVEKDSTNLPGVYELGLDNAGLATGVHSVLYMLKGATNMAPLLLEIELTNTNNQDGVRGGMTALPNAAFDTTSSLFSLDSVNTGSTHNTNNTVGKQIRLASGNVPTSIRTGTAQAGSASNTIVLDAGASATNNIYVGLLVELTGGTGLGQTRTIVGYVGSTKTATVSSNWVTTPDNTTTFSILASANSIVSNEGTAQAGAASTITLATTATATDSFYNNSFVTILSGTGNGQTRVITAYVGATKVATVDSAWSVNPDNTSVYAVIPSGNQTSDNIQVPTPAQIAAAILKTPSNLLATNSSGFITTTYAVLKNTGLTAFPFVMTDKTTGTPKTGVTVTATRSLDGGAYAACANAVTELANGSYLITLASTDLNANTVMLHFTGAGANDLFMSIITQS